MILLKQRLQLLPVRLNVFSDLINLGCRGLDFVLLTREYFTPSPVDLFDLIDAVQESLVEGLRDIP